MRMHADEVDVDAALVRRLVADQFPSWGGLPLERVPSGGTDNAIFRLGDELSVRLPRIGWAVGQVDKDLRWMPVLRPRLPVAVPEPVARGQPTAEFPWPWGIYRWLAGESLRIEELADPAQAAIDLARCLKALRALHDDDPPPASSRGIPLRTRDEPMRDAIAAARDEVDAAAVTAEWEAALQVPEWDGAPVWIHGDLVPGNLLFEQGRLSAIIDFSLLCVGDPATDAMAAWTLFSAGTRGVFREELGIDDETWARGRGWALSCALIALPYYLDTNPFIVRSARRTIDEVLADAP